MNMFEQIEMNEFLSLNIAANGPETFLVKKLFFS